MCTCTYVPLGIGNPTPRHIVCPVTLLVSPNALVYIMSVTLLLHASNCPCALLHLCCKQEFPSRKSAERMMMSHR